jgi:hypothetical protein
MMVIIKESYNTYWNKPMRPKNDINGGMSDNIVMAYLNDCLNNLHNFYMMKLSQGALLQNIRRMVAQQNQNALTMNLMYDITATQQQEGAKIRRIVAVNSAPFTPELEEDVTTFQK